MDVTYMSLWMEGAFYIIYRFSKRIFVALVNSALLIRNFEFYYSFKTKRIKPLLVRFHVYKSIQIYLRLLFIFI
jgi:hypothetical protein